jgi:hypothetical protein
VLGSVVVTECSRRLGEFPNNANETVVALSPPIG